MGAMRRDRDQGRRFAHGHKDRRREPITDYRMGRSK